MIYEYMLNIDVLKHKSIPGWVEKRLTLFYNDANKTHVGWSPNEGERDYYIPDSVVVLSKQDLVSRALSLHAITPIKQRDYTREEIKNLRKSVVNEPEKSAKRKEVQLKINIGIPHTEQTLQAFVESLYDELES